MYNNDNNLQFLFLGFVLLLTVVYIALKYKLFVEFFVEEWMD